MILYTFMSSYQLLECIENKLIFHKDDEAILMVYPFALDKFPHYKVLVEDGIFNDAFIFESGRISYDSNDIVADFENVFNSNSPIKINEIDNFVIFGVHMPISIYLMEKNISFEMGEDGSGAYSRPYLLSEIERKSFEKKYNVLNEYGLYNLQTLPYSLINRLYFNEIGQTTDYVRRKELYDFNLVSAFSNIPIEFKKNILDFFNCPTDLVIKDDAIILFTQQFANLNQMSFEEQIQIYQLMIDVFLDEERVVIKAHPDDVLFYELLFPQIEVVRNKFPSELLPYISNVPHELATITSSSIHMFPDNQFDKLYFDMEYEQHFKYTFRYKWIMDLLNKLNIIVKEENGTLNRLVDNLQKYSRKNVENVCSQYSAIIVDDFSDKDIEERIEEVQSIICDADKDTVIIFVNCLEKYAFYTYENRAIYENIIPIGLKRTVIHKEYNYYEEGEETIFIYSLNDDLLRRIRMMEDRVEYKNSGIIISKEELSGDKLKIKILEGQLRATEERLLRYIEKEQEEKM